MDTTPSTNPPRREPWNKGKLVGQKAPFICSYRIHGAIPRHRGDDALEISEQLEI